MKDQDTLGRCRVVECPENSILALHAQFRNARRDCRHRSRVRHDERLPHLQPEESAPQANSRFLRKPANRIPRFRMKDNRPHSLTVSNMRHKVPEPFIFGLAQARGSAITDRAMIFSCDAGAWI